MFLKKCRDKVTKMATISGKTVLFVYNCVPSLFANECLNIIFTAPFSTSDCSGSPEGHWTTQ